MASLPISACQMPWICRSWWPKKIVYSDHKVAAVTPTEISVSMDAVPWRALRRATRWNGHAAQVTIGAASAVSTHSQPVNRVLGDDGEHHRQISQRHEQHRGDGQPAQQAAGQPVVGIRLLGRRRRARGGVVAGLADHRAQVLGLRSIRERRCWRPGWRN